MTPPVQEKGPLEALHVTQEPSRSWTLVKQCNVSRANKANVGRRQLKDIVQGRVTRGLSIIEYT